jgi:hypothetical protein
MFIDNSVVINLMSYSVFKKLRRVDDKLMKANLTLNGGGTQWRQRHRLHGVYRRE